MLMAGVLHILCEWGYMNARMFSVLYTHHGNFLPTHNIGSFSDFGENFYLKAQEFSFLLAVSFT